MEDEEVLTPEEQEEERKRLEYAEMKIAEAQKAGKKYNKTWEACIRSKGTIIVNDERLFL